MSNKEDAAKESYAAYQASDHAAALRGVQYLVDEFGKRTVVGISLEEWGELWEDFCDVLVSESRKDEPAIPSGSIHSRYACEAPARGISIA
jgi:hypothetical protein